MTDVIYTKDWLTEKDKKLKSFEELLSSIDGLDLKLRNLYKEIYENAICDRAKSEACFNEIYNDIQASTDKFDKYVICGDKMKEFLTRMEKSNAQLIRLAEIVGEQENKQQEANMDSFFEEMKNGTNK